MKALERIKEIDPDALEEYGYCAKEKGRCGQCGYDAKFLLNAFNVMREIANKAASRPSYLNGIMIHHGNMEADLEFEERMSK